MQQKVLTSVANKKAHSVDEAISLLASVPVFVPSPALHIRLAYPTHGRERRCYLQLVLELYHFLLFMELQNIDKSNFWLDGKAAFFQATMLPDYDAV
jgi:hypothetical protein